MYVGLNLTFTISNVDMTAAEFTADYNAQAVVKVGRRAGGP